MSGLHVKICQIKEGEQAAGKWVVFLNNGGKGEDDKMILREYFDSPKEVVEFFGEFALELGDKYARENWEEYEN